MRWTSPSWPTRKLWTSWGALRTRSHSSSRGSPRTVRSPSSTRTSRSAWQGRPAEVSVSVWWDGGTGPGSSSRLSSPGGWRRVRASSYRGTRSSRSTTEISPAPPRWTTLLALWLSLGNIIGFWLQDAAVAHLKVAVGDIKLVVRRFKMLTNWSDKLNSVVNKN